MTWYRLKNLDLGFIESFYTQLPEDVWKATTGEVGRFWDARDRIVFRYTINQNILSLEIHSLTDVEGITFLLHGMKIKKQSDILIKNGKLVLDIKKGFNKWLLELE